MAVHNVNVDEVSACLLNIHDFLPKLEKVARKY
jgi:hypothetical protein